MRARPRLSSGISRHFTTSLSCQNIYMNAPLNRFFSPIIHRRARLRESIVYYPNDSNVFLKNSGGRINLHGQAIWDFFAATIVAGFPGEMNPFLNQIIGFLIGALNNSAEIIKASASFDAGNLIGASGLIGALLLMLCMPTPFSLKLVSPS